MKVFRLHLLDVGAGRKRLFAAGQQDASDPVVGLEIVDGGGDFLEHAERQRIEHLRAIERDDADRAFVFDDDVFERAHGPTPHQIVAGNVPAGGMCFKWGRSNTGKGGRRDKLRHEHAGGGGHRQQRSEADEDFADQ